MKNTVNVEGIEVFAYHGCMEEEERLGGKFVVDISIDTDFRKSGASDELEDTIDYVVVRRIAVEEMEIRSKLIEHVGYRIVNRLKATFPAAEKVRVTVRKLAAPIQGLVKEVSICIEE